MAKVYIGLNNGVALGVSDNDHLIVIDRDNMEIDLGLATIDLFNRAIEYLDRLKIHAVKE